MVKLSDEKRLYVQAHRRFEREEKLEAYVKKAVDVAPPFSPEQIGNCAYCCG